MILTIAWASATTSDAHGQLVRVSGSTERSPIVSKDALEERLAIFPRRGIRLSDLRVQLVDVRRVGTPGTPAFTAFRARLQRGRRDARGEKGRGPAIVVTVSPVVPPGDYRVRLRVVRGRRAQPIRMRLRLSRATLRPPATVRVERTVYLFGVEDVERGELALRETSERSRLSDITATPLEAAKLGEDQATGDVEVDPPAEVKPGKAGVADVGVDGEFPLGTATGRFELDATEIESPVAVTYEVRSRLSEIWLLVVILAGVVLGWATRTWLVARMDLAWARAQAYAVLDEIERERARWPGQQAFEDALATPVADLSAALESRDPQQLKDSADAATTELREAVDALEAQRTEVRKALDALLDLAGRSWSVPPDVGVLLGSVREALAGAEADLQAGRVSDAKKQVAGASKGLSAEIATRAREWRDAVLPLLGVLSAKSPAAPGSTDPTCNASAVQVRELVDAEVLKGSEGEAKETLKALHEATQALRAFLPRAESAAVLVATRVRDTLHAADALKEPHDVAIDEAVNRLDAGLAEASRLTAPGSEASVDALAALGRALSAAIRRGAETKSRAHPKAQLQAGDYEAAALSAVEQATAAERAARAAAVGAPEPGLLPAGARLMLASAAVMPMSVSSVPAGGAAVAAAPTFAARRAREFREIARAKLLQTLLLGLAVVVSGLFLFAGDWTGDLNDMATVFAWGFAANITADFVTDALASRTAGGTTGSTGTTGTTPETEEPPPT